MHLHAARVRGGAQLVEVGFVVQTEPLVELEPAARSGAVQQAS
jgi:hypothetical protein